MSVGAQDECSLHKRDVSLQLVSNLPSAFVNRMYALLGHDANAFLDGFSLSPRPGLRVNTLKTSPGIFRSLSPFSLQPVPWCAEGYLVDDAERSRPGRHPHHAAGLYYLQDASAMAVGVMLDPQPGECVLDLCAAPGGKATHIAARMQNKGLLVANELVPGRTNALVANLEVFGATRILVVSESVDVLADAWAGAFDRVLVDAPCSGEGLFRKNPAACLEWTPGSADGCAARQNAILAAAADLVRPGGRLVYATCTFAPQENEAVVARFLRARGDYCLVCPPPLPGLSPGRPDWIPSDLARGLPLERCVRIWPHRAPGEGHFMAVLEREGHWACTGWPAHRGSLPREAARLLGDFWGEALTRPPATDPPGGWHLAGQGVHWLPAPPETWRGLRVVRAGWRVGTLRVSRSRLDPSHALAMAVRSEDARQIVELGPGSPHAAAYLRGETCSAVGADGWVLVTYDSFPLGWGKRVQGVVKNHYPRPLRWR